MLKFIQIYIKITDIVDVVSYLKTFKTKNLGQNKDNLINYLSKDYGYNKESANKVIEKAVKENVVRELLQNCGEWGEHNDCTRNATEWHTTERRRYN